MAAALKKHDEWKSFAPHSPKTSIENFALKHAEQYLGCVHCKHSHHETSFCKCGRCFYEGKYKHDDTFGTFVKCNCGEVNWWD